MKGKHHSKVTKTTLAEMAKKNNTGRHWYNNGINEQFVYNCPDGFVSGRLRRNK